MQVLCAVVNDGSVLAVDADAGQTVNDLEVLIKECAQLTCAAHSLVLDLTKQQADSHAWFDSSHEDLAKLETGRSLKASQP